MPQRRIRYPYIPKVSQYICVDGAFYFCRVWLKIGRETLTKMYCLNTEEFIANQMPHHVISEVKKRLKIYHINSLLIPYELQGDGTRRYRGLENYNYDVLSMHIAKYWGSTHE